MPVTLPTVPMVRLVVLFVKLNALLPERAAANVPTLFALFNVTAALEVMASAFAVILVPVCCVKLTVFAKLTLCPAALILPSV